MVMGQAWPALQTLWIYNWGEAGSLGFPAALLASFATHMPPTLRGLSLEIRFNDISPLTDIHGRFASLEVLGVGEHPVPKAKRPRVAAFLAKICPPGLLLRSEEDFAKDAGERSESLDEIMVLMQRGYLEAGTRDFEVVV